MTVPVDGAESLEIVDRFGGALASTGSGPWIGHLTTSLLLILAGGPLVLLLRRQRVRD